MAGRGWGEGAGENDLQFITQTAVNANDSSQVILDLVNDYQTDATYPDTEFGARCGPSRA